MTELHWTPEQVGQMTIPQIICLIQKEPPGLAMIDNLEDYRAVVEREAEEERAWCD